MFLDLGNLYFCVNKRWPGRRLDLDKFYNYLQRRVGGQIQKAIAYGTELDGEAHGFKGFLRAVGFEPRFKAHKFKEGGEVYRTDWGIGLVLDVVALVDKVDCVIICTSNPEYKPLVEWVQTKGTRVVVCACGISRQLRQAVQECYEVTEDMLLPKITQAS